MCCTATGNRTNNLADRKFLYSDWTAKRKCMNLKIMLLKYLYLPVSCVHILGWDFNYITKNDFFLMSYDLTVNLFDLLSSPGA